MVRAWIPEVHSKILYIFYIFSNIFEKFKWYM